MKKTYVESYSNSFMYSANKVKMYNLVYLNMDSNPTLQALIKSI